MLPCIVFMYFIFLFLKLNKIYLDFAFKVLMGIDVHMHVMLLYQNCYVLVNKYFTKKYLVLYCITTEQFNPFRLGKYFCVVILQDM